MVCAGGFLLAFTALAASAELEDPPNLLVLVTDDQRFDMLGKLTPHLVTPEMDRLAAEGTHFRNAFVTTSICAASRASMLTGLHELTHGYTFGTPPLAERLVAESYPVLLRAAGYRTGHIGKLGVNLPEGSLERMFDRFEPFAAPYWKTVTNEDGEEERRHLTDLTGDRAVEFLRTEDERPFCLTIGFNAPHADDPAPEQYFWPPSADGLYEDLVPPLPPSSEPEFYERLHPYLKDGTMNRDRWKWRFDDEAKRRAMTRGYYRMISGVDHVIGRLRRVLEETGKAENTVILFVGDNGYFLGERGYAGKWLPHEPSLRVPLIVSDPRVTPVHRGREVEAMALNIDLPATILRLAGLELPTDMQGRSLLPFVYGEPVAEWRTEFFVEHRMEHPRIRKHEGVRTERFKYTRYYEAEPVLEELYDLLEDPLETRNLIDDPEYEGEALGLRHRTDRQRTLLTPRIERSSEEDGQAPDDR